MYAPTQPTPRSRYRTFLAAQKFPSCLFSVNTRLPVCVCVAKAWQRPGRPLI